MAIDRDETLWEPIKLLELYKTAQGLSSNCLVIALDVVPDGA